MKLKLLIIITLLFYGCSSGNGIENKVETISDYTLSPDSSDLFGNIKISLTLPENISVSDKAELYIAGKELYSVYIKNNKIIGYIQGNRTPGKYDLKISDTTRKYIIPKAFTYIDNRYGFNKKIVSVGASYTNGFINMTLKRDEQIFSPFAQLANEIGIYFPQSYLRNDFFSGITIDQFRGGCSIDKILTSLFYNLMTAIERAKDKNGKFYLDSIRILPDSPTYNYGIGAAKAIDTIEGAGKNNNALIAILENLIYNPHMELFDALQDPPVGSPLSAAVKMHPDIIMSVDLFADDIFYYYFAKLMRIPNIYGITNTSEIETELRKFARILKDNNIKGFIADLPDITVMPIFQLIKTKLMQFNVSQERIDEIESNISQLTVEYNKIFYKIVGEYEDTIIPVHFRDEISKVSIDPITINGYDYNLDFFEGIVSLDFIHPTRTGYAMIANLFIDALNQYYSTDIKPIDLAKVAKNDPLSKENLAKLTINYEECKEQLLEIK